MLEPKREHISGETAGSNEARISKNRKPSASQAHRNSMRGEIRLRIADAECAEVKNRGGENRGSVAVANPLGKMLECADSARRDDRHAHRIGNGAGQCDVEAGFGAVSVHRGQQDLAGPVTSEAARPFDSVDNGRPAPPLGETWPLGGCNLL